MTNDFSLFSSWTIQHFTSASFSIQLYDCNLSKAPIVYLLAHQIDPNFLSLLQEKKLPPFSLACIEISNAQWNTLLAPWDTPQNFPKYLRCKGGAPDYLKTLIRDIIPEVQAHLSHSYGLQTIAGYSLAGLFSVFAMCQWDQWAGVCAVSGSFWYPDFQAWFLEHIPSRLPMCVYFSTSEKEWNSKNLRLSSLRPTLEVMEKILAQKGVKTICEINLGNHFQNSASRLATGIEWMLNHLEG